MGIPAEDEGQLRGFSVYALGRVAKVTRAGPPGAQFSFGWGVFAFRQAQLGCRLEPDWLCGSSGGYCEVVPIQTTGAGLRVERACSASSRFGA